MRKFIAFALIALCGTVFSTAQQQKTQQPNKWDIFGGYSYGRAYGYPNWSTEDFSSLALEGGQASVTYYPTRHLGFTADFADDTNSITHQINGSSTTFSIKSQDYLFGPTLRFSFKSAKYQHINFFVHQLFGVSHVSFTSPDELSCGSVNLSTKCSFNPFKSVSGGGIDINVNRHLSIRPMQMDYWSQQISFSNMIYTDDSSASGLKTGEDGFRYSAGAVLKF